VLHKRHYPSFTPTIDGKYLLLGTDEKQIFKEISKFSKQDAKVYGDYLRKLDEIVDIINPIIDTSPSENLFDLLKVGMNSK